MKQNQARFESFPWEMEIIELEELFDVIDDFLNDEEAKNAHLRKKHPATFTALWNRDPNQILLDGVQTFRRQMVVLLKTYLEKIIKDFAENVFIGTPQKMAAYLLLDEFQDAKPLGELEKILEEGKTTTLTGLPKNAASRIMKGGLSKTLDKVKKISNVKIKTRTKTTLVKLNEIRTHIVHDVSAEEISTEFLRESFDAVRDLIVSFREVCALNNISDVDNWEENIDASD